LSNPSSAGVSSRQVRSATDASVEYIKSYRGTPDTLHASLERIRATAQRLSTELEAIRLKDDQASDAS